MKKCVFLGTGGTIAGLASNPSDNVGYRAGQVGIAQLLLALPSLASVLPDWVLESEQVCQVDSKDMDWPQWRDLVAGVRRRLRDPAVSALVITHGTDTLEETAFFLSEVLGHDDLRGLPVVLTCAMRPASALSPDGPQNLLDACAVAADRLAAGGVWVVCAGRVHAARRVQKVHPYRLDPFDSGEAGVVACVEEGRVRWLQSADADPEAGLFAHLPLDQPHWPRIELVWNCAHNDGATVSALLEQHQRGTAAPLAGLVVAGTGNGTVGVRLQQALREAQAQGIAVLRTTRCAEGAIVPGRDEAADLAATALAPLKARIRLALQQLDAQARSQQGKSG